MKEERSRAIGTRLSRLPLGVDRAMKGRSENAGLPQRLSGWRGRLRDQAAGIFVALAFVLLPSCSTRTLPPLRVGLPPWVPAEFAFIARELGFFDEREIELVPYRSPIELARHFRDGNLDAAALPLDFVPYWAPAMHGLDVAFVIDISNGADGLVANAGVTDVAALKGRRVGVESSPLGAHMLLRALMAGGLRPPEIETVSVDSEDQADAFLSGKVDAVVTREPDRSRLLSKGARSLFDSSQAPGLVVDALVLSTATAVAHQDALRKLVAGWLAAFALLTENRAATVERIAAGLSVDNAAVERALAGVRLGELTINRSMLGGSPPRLAATLEELARTAVGAGLLREAPIDGVRFDESFLPSIVTRPAGSLPGAVSR